MEGRKVKGIYDAIDAHNYKQALKLANAALQKKPDPFITVDCTVIMLI